MYFDGEKKIKMEVELDFFFFFFKISLKGTHIPFSRRLNFLAINNATDYEACIIGLQVDLGLGVKELEVYGDSALIIS